MSSGAAQPTQAPPTANAPPVGPTRLDRFEQLAKIFSLVAIPVVIPVALAFFSARVQQGAQRESINRDYVQLAVTVLTQKGEVDPGLRNWAVDLLNERSPTKFAPEVIADLKSGSVSLPDIIGGVSSGGKIAAVSSDRKYLAVDEGSTITVTDTVTGRRKLTKGGMANAVSLDFSPDGSRLAVGTTDGIVHLLDMTTGGEIRLQIRIGHPILAVKIGASGEINVITEGTIYMFDKNGASAGAMTIPGAPTLSIKVR